MARDPPSYDSGIPLSEAVAKTMMDKIEARSKWLQAKRQEAIYMGSKWRVILARAKIFEGAWHKLPQKGTMDNDGKWLKANGKVRGRPPLASYLGKHQRAILTRAKFKADVKIVATTNKPSDVDGHRP